MNFDEILNSIDEKLGEETFGMISDDIANLMGYNEALNNDIKAKDEKIEKLTKKNDMLIEANGNLLQKVSAGIEEKKTEEKEEPKKKIDLRAAFDKNGNFIK
ncbi:MAG: hypothetical protein IKL65_05545 [Bacilli bacterium]|nr:hypothetical protein [Bacilli bacterium]MBR6690777.1 hypothetical protein [Bacilli bacterium]